MISIELTEQDLENIKEWHDGYSSYMGDEDSKVGAVYTSDIGTLLKFGMKKDVTAYPHRKIFKHDCNDCVFIGSINRKFNCCPEGRYEGFWGEGVSKSEEIKRITTFMNKIYNDKTSWKQADEYVVEYVEEWGSGNSVKNYFKKVDKVKIEYDHHDIYFCTETKSLVVRYGNKGEEYYSGTPEELKQVLKNMKEKEPTFSLIKIYERALELFSETGIV